MTLPSGPPRVDAHWRRKLERLVEQTAAAPPPDLPAVIRESLGVDLTARHAGLALPHPFGKASGQLSCTAKQVRTDVESGIAFIVLKTVIAESVGGARSMEAWATDETHMAVERRRSAGGREGWTVTWRGRGWSGTLERYLEFFAEALAIARARDVVVIPSVKFHLPAAGEPWRRDEYEHTTRRLLDVWDRAGCGGPMLLEKDLSPTLAGDARAGDRAGILGWLRTVPGLIESAAPGRTRLGVKVMNALFDDAFQVRMVRTLIDEAKPVPRFLVLFNRLFDQRSEVAYGGWDLTDRNLRVLDAVQRLYQTAGAGAPSLPSFSATGNICSGREMLAYAARGCENGQVHTFFQVPLSQYVATGGTRPARALFTLLLHPTEGLAVWLRHLHEAGRLDARGGCVRFLDVVDGARSGA